MAKNDDFITDDGLTFKEADEHFKRDARRKFFVINATIALGVLIMTLAFIFKT